MFTYFAHAGHDHSESTSTSSETAKATVAEVRTEQNVSANTDHTPIIVGSVVFALAAVVLLGAAYIAGNRRAAKKK